MPKLIANKKVYVGFTTTAPVSFSAPKVAEVTAATNLTALLVTLDSSTRGNVVATPSLDTTFETSIAGTVTATFTAEFYRDDTLASDKAWTTLPRGTTGYFYISRFVPSPIVGTKIEVWPVQVTSRTAIALANNDSQRMSIECSVFSEPTEDATVAA